MYEKESARERERETEKARERERVCVVWMGWGGWEGVCLACAKDKHPHAYACMHARA